MRRLVAAVVLFALAGALAPSAFAVGKDKAEYVGGTLNTVPQASEGVLSTSGEDKLIFVAEKGAGIIEVPYKRVEELEYGQKVGRRWKSAILWAGPAALLFKGRKHFLTITFKDQAGKDQAAVFEIGKDAIRTTLAVLETRTGRKVVYQDEEAAKNRGN